MAITKLFSYLYDKTLFWSGHRHATYYLAGVSFAESAFFPIPPDVMLISMGLALPKNAWRYALITTLFSVIGGVFGYWLGYLGIELIQPLILASSYAADYQKIATWFVSQGVWIVILAGFTPLPYKLFTITAGALHMAFLPFVVASFIGRGMRFFLVSGILFFAGERIQTRLRHYIDVIGWSTIAIFIIVYFWIRWNH